MDGGECATCLSVLDVNMNLNRENYTRCIFTLTLNMLRRRQGNSVSQRKVALQSNCVRRLSGWMALSNAFYKLKFVGGDGGGGLFHTGWPG